MSGSSKEHIIKSYDDELLRLTGELVRMGELAVSQLEAAIDVVDRRDERAADHRRHGQQLSPDVRHGKLLKLS